MRIQIVRVRIVATGLALALGAAACGSTAQVRGTGQDVALGGTPGVGAEDELVLSEEDFAAPDGAETETDLGLGSGPAPGGGGRDAPATGGPTGPSPGGSPRGSAAQPPAPSGTQAQGVAPGVTDTTIFLGVQYNPALGESAAALGAEGIDPGDERANWNAVFEHINAEGGVAGRKLEAVFFRNEGYNSQTQADQAACTLWTQDKPVFAILGKSSPLMRECAQRAGILIFGMIFSSATTEVFQRYANYIEVAMVRLDRAAEVTVNGLHANGYFTTGARIGIVAWDDPDYHTATDRGLIRTLARHGLEPLDVRYIKVVESETQLADTSAQVNNAVLRFQTLQIDHVMIVDGPAGAFQGTGLTLLFLKSASSQRYYPKYGFNNANSPEGGIDAGLWNPEELQGSHLVTWGYNANNPDNAPNPAREFCSELFAKRGIHPDNPNAWTFALFACDMGLFIRAAVQSGGNAPSLEATLSGVARLGRSYRSPFTFANRFGPDRRDGAAAARNGVYRSDCHCYKYTTQPYDLP